MPFATALSNASDAMVWLDPAIVDDLTEISDNDEQRQAASLIFAKLYGKVDPVQMAMWDATNPASVPEVIRSIAGRLVAAFHYRKVTSEDIDGVSRYAAQLYNEALNLLNDIRDGVIEIPEVDTDVLFSAGHFAEGMFFPDDTDDSGPKFNMSIGF